MIRPKAHCGIGTKYFEGDAVPGATVNALVNVCLPTRGTETLDDLVVRSSGNSRLSATIDSVAGIESE
jgi:hypothetical protein